MASVERGAQQRSVVKGPLRIEIGPSEETCLIRLAGEMDMSTVAAFDSELHRLLSTDLKTIVVDLGGLDFVDSIALQCLVRATRESRQNGDRLRMLAAGGEVDRVLRLTGVHDVLPLID